MKVLLLTIGRFRSINDRGMYTDLAREFRDLGHDVYVVCPAQRREGGGTQLVEEDGVRILRVRTGNLTQAGLLEKTLSTVTLGGAFKRGIKSAFPDLAFDLILYSTPPVTLAGVVEYLKKRHGGVAYLLLKDIFPQNAVDLGYIRRGGLPWLYFRGHERRLYRVSDWIGCMSQATIRYVIDHNPSVQPEKLEICPNTISPLLRMANPEARDAARSRLGLCDSDVLFLYGGNFGKPQGFDFILECITRVRQVREAVFLLVGSGTEFHRVEKFLDETQIGNVRLLSEVPRDEYDMLMAAADVGLVFLDHRFTVPNFPLRVTGYMEAGIPVIAATDRASDVGEVLESAGAGVWVPSDDPEAFVDAVRMMTESRERRVAMGHAGRRYLEEHYTSRDACSKILAHFEIAEHEES